MKRIVVLLVEDDPDDRELFRQAMSETDRSVEIEFANDGLEAYRKLQSGHPLPDIIFSDVNMPLMNGIQLLEKVKASRMLKYIPFVVYTTSSCATYKSQTDKLGAFDYIVKPCCFRQICTEIRQVLGKIKNKLTLWQVSCISAALFL